MEEVQTHSEKANPHIKDISRILADLIKIAKIVSVYPENNPIPAKLKESFAERFLELIAEVGGMTFTVSASEEIRFENEVVYRDNPPDETLARIFHSSGITEISFKKAFGFKEVGLFFKAMKSYINKEPGAGDLVTLFWQAKIAGFDYCTVEDMYLRQYDAGMIIRETADNEDWLTNDEDDEGDTGRVAYATIFLDDSQEIQTGAKAETGQTIPSEKLAEDQMGLAPAPSRGAMSLPDTALILNEAYALDESEEAAAEKVLRADAEFEPYRSTLELIRAILSQEEDLPEFSETVTIAEKIQSQFLRSGLLGSAGDVLQELKRVHDSTAADRGQRKEKLKNALAMAGSREKMGDLLAALNSNPRIAPPEIESYLDNFGWESFSAVVGLLGELENRSHREAICSYLVRSGGKNVDIIARGIYDKRWFVVRNTVHILAAIGGDRAYTHLEKAIGHEDHRVRLQMVHGLATHDERGAALLLAKLLRDKEESVRYRAMEALQRKSEAHILEAVSHVIQGEHFSELDRPVQENVLILYSKLAGEQAVDYLAELISDKKIVLSATQDFCQQAAFKALGNNVSEKAENVLLKCSHSWRKRIRRLASEALTMRRDIRYRNQ